ncbi:MAG: hypothetical protein ACO3QP_06375 [Burkholderiaceae bacterium]
MSTSMPAPTRFSILHHRSLWLGLAALMALMVWWPALAVPTGYAGKEPCAVHVRAESELIRLHRESTLTGMALVTAQHEIGPSSTKASAP